MKKTISIILVLVMMMSAFVLTSCNDEPDVPPIGIDTGDATGDNPQDSGNEPKDTEPEEEDVYEPDPDALFGGYVALGATSAAVQYDNLKIMSTRLKQAIYENDFEGEDPLSTFTYKTADGGSWGGDAADWSLLPIETVADDETVTTNNVLSFANADSSGAMALYGGADWNLIQVSLKCCVAEGGGAMRLYFGVQDEKNYYVLDIGGGDNSTVTVKHVDAGKESLDTFALPYKIIYDEWFNVSITLNSDTVSVYVKGTLLYEAYKEVDSSKALYGGIGYGTWSTDVSYDNVKVTKIEDGTVLYENDFENDTLSDDVYSTFLSSDATWTTVTNGEDWRTDWSVVEDTELYPDSTHGKVLKLDYANTMCGAGILVNESVGNTDWNNYIFEFDARKDGGAEGFMIYFAIVDPEVKTAIRWNQGGWSNTQSCYQVFVDGTSTNTNQVAEKYTTGEWYHMTIVVVNNNVFGYVNGALVQCYTK